MVNLKDYLKMKNNGLNGLFAFVLMMLLSHTMSAQEKPEKKVRQPEIKWDVQKQLDENGNVIRYDSTYSWSWSNHDFDDNLLDSLFEEYFGDFRLRGNPGNFPDSVFFSPFGQIQDSLPYPGDFPDAFRFPGFPDPMEWFERQQEMFHRFYEMHPFLDDSLQRFRFEQRYPGEQPHKSQGQGKIET